MFKTYLSSSKVSFEYLVKTKGGLKLSPKLVSQRIQFRGQLMMGPVVTERSINVGRVRCVDRVLTFSSASS